MIDMTTVDKEGRAKIEPVVLVPKDYVPVVRCKDCKWWQMVDDYDGVYGQCKHLRSVIKKSIFVNENFFCADGERKENVD